MKSCVFEGEIIKVTISRTARRWFVSITVDTGTPNHPRDTRGLPVVGIDVGINSLATLDNGKKYPNPRPLKRYERKLKREQRSLSRKAFLSNNWYKQKRKVERSIIVSVVSDETRNIRRLRRSSIMRVLSVLKR